MPDVAGIAAEQLRQHVTKIESLAEQRAEIQAEITEAFKSAAGDGFDVKALRKLIALRKMRADERRELESILDLYRSALGDV